MSTPQKPANDWEKVEAKNLKIGDEIKVFIGFKELIAKITNVKVDSGMISIFFLQSCSVCRYNDFFMRKRKT
jgi:hypothetical protein